MSPIDPALCLWSILLAPPQGPDEPPLAERHALADRFAAASDLVSGGIVRPRWFDDGSSFLYQEGGSTWMFVDPQAPVPRKATSSDRDREVPQQTAFQWGRLMAPGSNRHALVRDGDLWAGGAGIEGSLRLTDDAEPGVAWSLAAEGWSSGAERLFATRVDTRQVHALPVIDYRKAVETLQTSPYVKAGTDFQDQQLAIFHLPGGSRTDVDGLSEQDLYLFPIGWREGDLELLFLHLNREATRLDLMGVDPSTGDSRVILTESRETFVGGLDLIIGGWRERFTPVKGQDRFLWLSERDGWRHVYQYDYAGNLIGRVTEGEYPVLKVVDVDSERECAFLMANAEDNLYATNLYRVDLEGGELERLTEGDGDHRVQLSPSMQFYVDTHSSLSRAPVSELHDVDSGFLCTLAEADTSALDELGWVPPEPFVVKSADGETDLYGALFKPVYFDPEKKYPVVDIIYSGPFMTVVPDDYWMYSPYGRRAQALAQMGFIVFLVDPRGTTDRSKAFQDASYGRIGEIEIPDHVATLHQLAAARPCMDLGRVGVYGHSWGGYFALRAMLTAPDTFHVGVSGAPGELTESAAINEPYMRTPQNNPEGYAAGLNAPLAANLKGKLLIIHGTADVNAPFSTSMRMVDALIEADKPFDLLVLPGATHSFQGAHARYATRRIRAFFLEHLRGE